MSHEPTDVYLVDGVRTPQGKYGGALAATRPDDLAALVVGEALRRSGAPPEYVEEVVLGAANQAGEDNRDVARMAVLLAGLPDTVPGYTADEGPRRDSSLESLGRLKPAFRSAGVVTAGNSSPLSDGAAALVLASSRAVERHGLTPRARIVMSASAGVTPNVMGLGPVPATEKALAKAGWSIDDLDVVEL